MYLQYSQFLIMKLLYVITKTVTKLAMMQLSIMMTNKTNFQTKGNQTILFENNKDKSFRTWKLKITKL